MVPNYFYFNVLVSCLQKAGKNIVPTGVRCEFVSGALLNIPSGLSFRYAVRELISEISLHFCLGINLYMFNTSRLPQI